jgi:hypothetical protein
MEDLYDFLPLYPEAAGNSKSGGATGSFVAPTERRTLAYLPPGVNTCRRHSSMDDGLFACRLRYADARLPQDARGLTSTSSTVTVGKAIEQELKSGQRRVESSAVTEATVCTQELSDVQRP